MVAVAVIIVDSITMLAMLVVVIAMVGKCSNVLIMIMSKCII